MMNENINNMIEELKEKYPKKWGDPTKGLMVSISDTTSAFENEYDFEETLFYSVWIMYKRNAVAINREDLRQNHFRITTDDYIRLEDLEELTKIINIVAKHLSKIDFKAHL